MLAELETIASKIYPMIETRRCVAWIGSGMSLSAGYLDWKSLIGELCLACGVPQLSKFELSSADGLLNKADECKGNNLDAYKSKLAELYGQSVNIRRSAYYDLMNIPFAGYVTTNFDFLLASAVTHVHRDKYRIFHYPDLPFAELNADNTEPVFYLHGLAQVDGTPTGENLVLSKTEFDEAYDGIVRSFLDQLFTYYSVFFIGCQLTEPFIQRALEQMIVNQRRIITTRPTLVAPSKMMLLSHKVDSTKVTLDNQSTLDQINEELEEQTDEYKKMGIDCFHYIPKDNNHEEIETVLEILCEQMQRPIIPMSSSGLLEA